MPHQTAGVVGGEVIDLTSENDDGDKPLAQNVKLEPKLEPGEEDDDDDDDDYDISQIMYGSRDPKARSPTRREQTPEEVFGRGVRIRKQPTRYEPSMRDKKYEIGVSNLCYTGNRYKLKDRVISLNIDTSHDLPVMSEEEENEHVLGVILIHQYNLKQGLELFGDKAELATVKELKQIHDMGTYVPKLASELSAEEKKKALSSLMFIVDKRDGRIKARKCAVGSKQRTFKG